MSVRTHATVIVLALSLALPAAVSDRAFAQTLKSVK